MSLSKKCLCLWTIGLIAAPSPFYNNIKINESWIICEYAHLSESRLGRKGFQTEFELYIRCFPPFVLIWKTNHVIYVLSYIVVYLFLNPSNMWKKLASIVLLTFYNLPYLAICCVTCYVVSWSILVSIIVHDEWAFEKSVIDGIDRVGELFCYKELIAFCFTAELSSSLKGHCHEHRFKNSRVQKHILQQRKPTNTGPVLM